VFGSWKTFLDALHKTVRIKDNELAEKTIEEFEHVVRHTGVIPRKEFWDVLYKLKIVTVPLETVVRLFCSFENLLNRSRVDKKRAIARQLVRFIAYGHKPKYEEWKKYAKRYRFESYWTICCMFGGWRGFIRECVTMGVFDTVLRKRSPRSLSLSLLYSYFDDEFILEKISEGYRILGRTPTVIEWIDLSKEHPTLPTYWEIVKRFGTWNNALRAAGLQPRLRRRRRGERREEKGD